LTEQTRAWVVALAGAPAGSGAMHASVIESVFNSIWGDFRLRFGMGRISGAVSAPLREALVQYAVTKRRILYLDQFRKLMGYWHSFHAPFAVFMYIVAAIHIATALIMQV
jgi:hypothetical protein